MAKIRFIKRGGQGQFWCPGCDSLHAVAIDEPYPNGARWKFNGDYLNPTLTPSVLVTQPGHLKDGRRCHLFLKNGVIQFLGDCTHELKGTYADLPPLPDWAVDFEEE